MARCLGVNSFRGRAAFGRCVDEVIIAGGIKRIKLTKISRTSSSLIPGLPEDLAQACLVRVSWISRSSLMTVCKKWAAYFRSDYYVAIRSQLRLSETLVVVLSKSRTFGQPNVSVFDPEAFTKLKSHRPLAVFNFPRKWNYSWTRFSCAVIGPDLFIIGGLHLGGGAGYCCGGREKCINGYGTRNSVFRFNFLSRKWTAAAPMHSARHDCACAVIDGKIYVAGGIAVSCSGCALVEDDVSRSRLKSAETYDYEHDQWHELPQMKNARAQCLGVAMEDHFYVIGGIAETRRFELIEWGSISADVFDTHMCEWKTIPSMWQRNEGNERLRFLPAVVGFDNSLYTADNEARMLRSYDDKLNRWIDVMPMPCLMRKGVGKWNESSYSQDQLMDSNFADQLIGLSSHGLYWMGPGGRLYNARQLDGGRWFPCGNVKIVNHADERPFLPPFIRDVIGSRDETYWRNSRRGDIVYSGIVCI